MPEQSVDILLELDTIAVRHVTCRGTCRHKSAQECAQSTNLVFPYRGLFVRHAGGGEAVADPNQMLFFNAAEDYCISHPVEGGDACLSLVPRADVLEELAPKGQLTGGENPRFWHQHRRIGYQVQSRIALLRHILTAEVSDPLAAEEAALALVQAALGEISQRGEPSRGRRKLADRAKLVLASDPSRRWRLCAIGREVGVSPVYLTQVFQQVEGIPLSRYQLQLRLARALDLIERYDDLTRLGLDLGFSSHSHFTAAFRRSFGMTPGRFRRAARLS
jgi:AraC-like DNA-binding protein